MGGFWLLGDRNPGWIQPRWAEPLLPYMGLRSNHPQKASTGKVPFEISLIDRRFVARSHVPGCHALPRCFVPPRDLSLAPRMGPALPARCGLFSDCKGKPNGKRGLYHWFIWPPRNFLNIGMYQCLALQEPLNIEMYLCLALKEPLNIEMYQR